MSGSLFAGAFSEWTYAILRRRCHTAAPVLDLNGVYRGTAAVQQFWREWLAAWETIQFEYELIDAGEHVVQQFDLRMRGRLTGIEVPFGKVAFVYTLRDGLVVHQKLYMSQSEALEAVGLSEQHSPADSV